MPCTCGMSHTRSMMLDGTYSEADTNSLAGYTEAPMVPEEMVPEKQEHMVVHFDAIFVYKGVWECQRQCVFDQSLRTVLNERLVLTKIHSSETETGHVKMDRVLVASEALLLKGDEEMKNQTHSKLKDLKALWDETLTYIIHCHSRIEWVWLHWSEYLKAHEEFGMWLEKMHRSLEPQLELQLGPQEKLWQVDHLRVLQSDIQAQGQFLERLLDEGVSLFNRTQDPSVDEQAQQGLQDAYNHIKDIAQERLALAEKRAEEHQQYQSCVYKFQTWLVSRTEEVSQFSDMEDTTQNKLKAVKELNCSIAKEELTLQHIEGLSEAVKTNTSPAGAERITEEMEELRLAWQRLRLALAEVQEDLQSALDSESEYSNRCKELRVDIAKLRTQVQNLSVELESRDGERTEDHMVAQWKTHTGVRKKLVAEEPHVEQLKSRLKELFRFPQDSRALSDEMLAVVKEYQSVKGRSFRLSSESESTLRNILQDPLLRFSQWSQAVSQVLDASADVTEFSHIALLVQNIEKLLKTSLQLQERLTLLQVKSDLLSSVFGQETADDLLKELSGDMRKRESLHSQLQDRKSRLQGLISKTKDFSEAYDSIHKKLSFIKERFYAANGLQPDILAKKSQADQLRVIRKDLEDCEAHILALETLVSSNPTNGTKFERLYAEWKLLYNAVRIKVNDSEENIVDHELFHENILNLEKWLMTMRQKLESFRGGNGEWRINNRQQEAERALGEFPEKEFQLHQMEAQGHNVLAKTSDEGKVHIQQDLNRLRESWMSLHTLSLNLFRLLNGHLAAEGQDSRSRRTECPDRWADGRHEGSGSGAASGFEGGHIAAGDEETGQRRHHNLDSQFHLRSESTDYPKSIEATQNQFQVVLPEDIERPGRTEVWRRDMSYHERTLDDEVDPVTSGGDGRANRKQIDGTDRSNLLRKSESGSADRTGEWVEEHIAGSGIEDLDMQGFVSGAHTDDAKRRLWPYPIPPDEITVTYSSIGSQHVDTEALRREFEVWLLKENNKLTKILNSQSASSAKELTIRLDRLKVNRSQVTSGLNNLQALYCLLMENKTPDEDVEDLRYRWMLYKSKLKEAGDLRALKTQKGANVQGQELVRSGKENSSPGFLYRVCRVALPLQLLLLALLLLAFLLPMMDEGTSCSLSNNFARSFNIMLRYDGPPPT
ncbi:Nesprin-3 KASH domain-containing protein 3 [Triplophysa tibetana]|uniref:Nesprin-3 KASH domain-containing protein 3 n=1 Tax=Triplophysa tibetana TaxID=1572043 RepID=A0A5A9NMP3_9TELE|nr:Nesprin-3 KASH domain-containing protein 3 [Triplophysa tibetana]